MMPLFGLPEKDGFNHIYIKYLFDSNDILNYKKGNWEITKFYGIDENNIIYFSSKESGSIYSCLQSLFKR